MILRGRRANTFSESAVEGAWIASPGYIVRRDSKML